MKRIPGMAITLFDITTRPKAPPIEGVTEMQRRQGQGLAHIHAMYRGEIEQVEELTRRIDSGGTATAQDMDQLGDALLKLQLVTNYRDFGNLCGRQCRLLTIHHTIEDRHLFPVLMNHSEGLDRVVRRLMEEHVVIHGLIEQLLGQALNLIADPSAERYQRVKQTFATLVEIVRSHFSYEETELQEALGFLNVPV